MQTRVATDPAPTNEVVDRKTLYTYLLLDVNVTSALPTSRIVEATSSLQFFINRALKGLEPGISFKVRAALTAQWQLDKKYRQWEANQKIPLHPQNFIERERRYHTSPEFKDLLQTVSGKDVTHDSVETAVNTYAGLARCGDLSLCGIYSERKGPTTTADEAVHHFMAQAKREPGRLFHRKLDADYKTLNELAGRSQYLKALDWGLWQEVVVPKTYEVFSDVSVCVFHNRHYFFWLELEERRDQGQDVERVSWILHPRNMRCDDNALTGPMQVSTSL